MNSVHGNADLPMKRQNISNPAPSRRIQSNLKDPLFFAPHYTNRF